MRKGIGQTVMTLAIALCFLLPLSAGRNVTVGLYPLGRFSYLDAKGRETGYCVEYVGHLAAIAGWDVRFVMTDSQDDATLALQEGKVDMLAPMEKDGSSPFSFPSCPFGIDYDGIYTLGTRNDIPYGDEESLSRLTIGMMEGSESGKRFPHGAALHTVSYEGYEELLSALGRKDVDAILTDALSVEGSLRIISASTPFPVYMAVGNGKSALLQELDDALATVKRSEPSYEAELAERYFPFTEPTGKGGAFVSFLSRHRVQLAIIGIFLLCILLFLFLALRTRKTEHLILGDKVRELKDANARATRATEAKGRFLSMMSHGIRTPMNTIIGLATVAKNDVGDPAKMTDYLQKIDESSKSLLSIINDMLDLSAIETDTMKINHERFSIRDLLSPVIIIAYHQCSQKGIAFKAHYRGDGNECFRGDSLRISQILQNLLSNAVRYTEKGGTIDFDISILSRQKGRETFRFTVRDNGTGISEEMSKSLFKPFEQARLNAASPEGNGTLGLSITKRLVEMMDGTISVQSAPLKGSTFTVDLPLDLSLDQPHLPIEANGKIGRAMVACDEETSQSIQSILERIRTASTVVSTGEAALQQMGEAEEQGNPYPLLFVDEKMPDMDGAEAIGTLRKMSAKETVILTSYDPETVREEAGADYYLQKPIFHSQLFDILQMIGKGQTQQAADKKAYDFTGRRVLVAEDVPLNMEVAVKMLQMMGIETDCAINGMEALQKFEQSKGGYYDAIFLDIQMPVMDGYESARRIRRSDHPDAKTIGIYAMTANAFSEDVTDALNAGMDGHIAKPIDQTILCRLLDKTFSEEDKRRGKE